MHPAMRKWGTVSLIFCLALGSCSKKEPAPVQDGSTLVYDVQEILGKGSDNFKLTIKLTAEGESFIAKLDTEPSRPARKTVWTVDRQLLPEDKVIDSYGLGRLWIPSNSRRQGVVTDCGRGDTPRQFLKWQSWVLAGRCGRGNGSFYYEQSTGMLVGWQTQIDGHNYSAMLSSAQ
jgi:hypothetical protein